MKAKVIIRTILVGLFIIVVNSLSAKHGRYHSGSHHRPNYKYTKIPHSGCQYKSLPATEYVNPHRVVRYHYHEGIYYKPYGCNYIVSRAPDGYKKIKINDEVYNELESVIYMAFIDNKGEVWFEVVEK